MAGSTPLGLLLQSEFDLQINDIKYRIRPPSDGIPVATTTCNTLLLERQVKNYVTRVFISLY